MSKIIPVCFRISSSSSLPTLQLKDLSDNKLSDNKLSDKKLSDNNLTSELVENWGVLEEIVIFMISNKMNNDRADGHCCSFTWI